MKPKEAETHLIGDQLQDAMADHNTKSAHKQLAGAGVAPGGLTAMMWHAHPDLNPETAETKAPTATPISPVYKQLKKFHDEADPDAAIRKEAHKLQMVAEGKSLSGLMELQQPGRET